MICEVTWSTPPRASLHWHAIPCPALTGWERWVPAPQVAHIPNQTSRREDAPWAVLVFGGAAVLQSASASLHVERGKHALERTIASGGVTRVGSTQDAPPTRACGTFIRSARRPRRNTFRPATLLRCRCTVFVATRRLERCYTFRVSGAANAPTCRSL